ncbi:MAG: SHOCT domain-containing protein [Thermoproteota archaeon]
MTDRAVGLVLLLAVIGAALICLPVIFMGMYSYSIWRFGRGMIYFGRGPAILFGLLVAIALIALGAYLFFSGSRESIVQPKSRAIEILNERYARGEITREDYLRMKEELRG